MNTKTRGLLCLTLLSLVLAAWRATEAQESSINLTLAKSYFQEAQELSNRDNGKLWGEPLYGPMLFVDAKTRTVVANQADREGILTRSENEGKLIASITMDRIASSVVSEGLATEEEVKKIISGLNDAAADAETVISLPRVFQAWGRRA